MGKLHQAIWQGDVERVQELVQLGANVEEISSIEAHSYQEYSPLELAVASNKYEIIRILLEAGAYPTHRVLVLLDEDIEDFEVGSLSALIQSGLDINARLEDGETVLMSAVLSGNFSAVKVLVEAGADVNVLSRKAGFALLKAVRYEEIFRYLIPLTNEELKNRAVQQLPSRFVRLINSCR